MKKLLQRFNTTASLAILSYLLTAAYYARLNWNGPAGDLLHVALAFLAVAGALAVLTFAGWCLSRTQRPQYALSQTVKLTGVVVGWSLVIFVCHMVGYVQYLQTVTNILLVQFIVVRYVPTLWRNGICPQDANGNDRRAQDTQTPTASAIAPVPDWAVKPIAPPAGDGAATAHPTTTVTTRK